MGMFARAAGIEGEDSDLGKKLYEWLKDDESDKEKEGVVDEVDGENESEEERDTRIEESRKKLAEMGGVVMPEGSGGGGDEEIEGEVVDEEREGTTSTEEPEEEEGDTIEGEYEDLDKGIREEEPEDGESEEEDFEERDRVELSHKKKLENR